MTDRLAYTGFEPLNRGFAALSMPPSTTVANVQEATRMHHDDLPSCEVLVTR